MLMCFLNVNLVGKSFKHVPLFILEMIFSVWICFRSALLIWISIVLKQLKINIDLRRRLRDNFLTTWLKRKIPYIYDINCYMIKYFVIIIILSLFITTENLVCHFDPWRLYVWTPLEISCKTLWVILWYIYLDVYVLHQGLLRLYGMWSLCKCTFHVKWWSYCVCMENCFSCC